MTRTEQLRTCKKCKYINFDVKKGFICSVISNYATFTEKCTDFKGASSISNKKLLKPSQLTAKEIIKGKRRFAELKKAVATFAMIFIGCMMLEDPNLFSMDANELTDSLARKTLNLIWGETVGFLILFAGFYLSYKLFLKRKNFFD